MDFEQLIDAYIALQRALLTELAKKVDLRATFFNGLGAGEIVHEGKTWIYRGHGRGMTLERDGVVVTVHVAPLLFEAVDAWRLCLYFESRGIPSILHEGVARKLDGEDSIEALLQELVAAGRFFRQDVDGVFGLYSRTKTPRANGSPTLPVSTHAQRLYVVAECPVASGFGGVVVLRSTASGALVFFAPCCGVAWREAPLVGRLDAVVSLAELEPGGVQLPLLSEIQAAAPELKIIRDEEVADWISDIPLTVTMDLERDLSAALVNRSSDFALSTTRAFGDLLWDEDLSISEVFSFDCGVIVDLTGSAKRIVLQTIRGEIRYFLTWDRSPTAAGAFCETGTLDTVANAALLCAEIVDSSSPRQLRTRRRVR